MQTHTWIRETILVLRSWSRELFIESRENKIKKNISGKEKIIMKLGGRVLPMCVRIWSAFRAQDLNQKEKKKRRDLLEF